MKKSVKGELDSEMKRELKRLKRIEKAHESLKMEHDLLKKASNSVRVEKRDLRIHRYTA